MDGYHVNTLLEAGPVQLYPGLRMASPGPLPWWRGPSEGMWGLLVLTVIGGCSFAAILLSSASLALAGI